MRGKASRLGSQASGLQASINGWDSGIDVRAYYDEEKKVDVFVVTLTNGSGYRWSSDVEIGRYTVESIKSPQANLMRGHA